MPRRAKFDPSEITTIYEKRTADPYIRKIKDNINNESLRLITNISNDMRDRVGEVLKQGEEDGKSVSVTASKLLTTGLDKGVFRSARKRAYLIAKTELHRSRQRAAMDVYREAGIGLLQWIGIPEDGRICPECRGRHGRTFRTSEVSNVDLPPIHPRCRCRLVPHDFDITITPKRGREGKIMETKISPTPKEYRYIVKIKPKKRVKKSLEKAVPYTRVRRGRMEHVRGYPGKRKFESDLRYARSRKALNMYGKKPSELTADEAKQVVASIMDTYYPLRPYVGKDQMSREDFLNTIRSVLSKDIAKFKEVKEPTIVRTESEILKQELLEDKKFVAQKVGVKPENLVYVGVQPTGEENKYFHMWNIEAPGHPRHMSSVVGIEWESSVELKSEKKEVRKGFIMNLKKSRKNLVSLRKSRGKGKLIPKNIDGKIRWTKAIGDALWIVTRTKKADVGDTVLIKGQVAKVTAIGEDGITARSLGGGKKYQVLHEHIKLIKAIK